MNAEPERGKREEMQEQFDIAIAVSCNFLKFYKACFHIQPDFLRLMSAFVDDVAENDLIAVLRKVIVVAFRRNRSKLNVEVELSVECAKKS